MYLEGHLSASDVLTLMYHEDTVVMITPEKLDSWRIVPRALILSYMVVFYQTCNWFMNLADPNNAQAVLYLL